MEHAIGQQKFAAFLSDMPPLHVRLYATLKERALKVRLLLRPALPRASHASPLNCAGPDA